ncbi:MAG: DUF3306 domain-containing protein [Arenicellales bacterium]
MSRHPQAPDDTDGFLKRWSRRKAGSGEPASADPAPVEDAPEPIRPGEENVTAGGGKVSEDERVETDADMPDLDSIDDTTDMSGFFSPGVSETLRSQALRRLFRLPKFNVTDGLDDYNEDYRSFAPLVETVVSDVRERLGRRGESHAPAREDAHRRDPEPEEIQAAGPAEDQPEEQSSSAEGAGASGEDESTPGVPS